MGTLFPVPGVFLQLGREGEGFFHPCNYLIHVQLVYDAEDAARYIWTGTGTHLYTRTQARTPTIHTMNYTGYVQLT